MAGSTKNFVLFNLRLARGQRPVLVEGESLQVRIGGSVNLLSSISGGSYLIGQIQDLCVTCYLCICVTPHYGCHVTKHASFHVDLAEDNFSRCSSHGVWF